MLQNLILLRFSVRVWKFRSAGELALLGEGFSYEGFAGFVKVER